MNEYEKIKLALFAIDHESYIIQEVLNDAEVFPEGLNSESTQRRLKARKNLLEDAVKSLSKVMVDLMACVDSMDGNNSMDERLIEVPFEVLYGGKTLKDYENEIQIQDEDEDD